MDIRTIQYDLVRTQRGLYLRSIVTYGDGRKKIDRQFLESSALQLKEPDETIRIPN